MLRSRLGVEPRLVPGTDGIFLVTLDGRPVVSNQGRCGGPLPSPEQVLRAIEEARSGW